MTKSKKKLNNKRWKDIVQKKADVSNVFSKIIKAIQNPTSIQIVHHFSQNGTRIIQKDLAEKLKISASGLRYSLERLAEAAILKTYYDKSEKGVSKYIEKSENFEKVRRFIDDFIDELINSGIISKENEKNE